ncbi:MAG: hypothetical protein PVS3B3_21880 [Ktedonobacteraceae bacterium]
MRKHLVVTVATIACLMLGAIVLWGGRTPVASAHGHTSAMQMQVQNQQQGSSTQETQDKTGAENGPEKDASDPGETSASAENQEQDQNMSGGGHQDQGQADHQFQGNE